MCKGEILVFTVTIRNLLIVKYSNTTSIIVVGYTRARGNDSSTCSTIMFMLACMLACGLSG